MEDNDKVEPHEDATSGTSTLDRLTEACLILAESTQQLVEVVAAQVALKEE